MCAFGCGGAHEGENAAAKRLFREAEKVIEQHMEDEGYGYGPDGPNENSFEEVQSNGHEQEMRCDSGSVSFTKPVDEWRRFLRSKERDMSVARV